MINVKYNNNLEVFTMLRKYKQFVLGFLIAALLFSSITVFADLIEIKAYFSDVKIALNGKILNLKDVNGKKVIPIIYEGTTYLPVRALANAFDKEVEYDSHTNTVIITEKIIENEKTIIEPEPLPKKTQTEPEETKLFSTIAIDGKEYITIGQFGDAYYRIGYRLQNTGSGGYFRFYHMYNGIQTTLIPKVKILIKDNEYYLDYNYFEKKMLPLIKE